MIGEYLRLAFASGLVLAPGWLVARACRLRSVSAALAFDLGVVFVAWALVFLVHGTIWLAVGVLAVTSVLAAAASLLGRPEPGREHVTLAARRVRLAAASVGGLGVVLGLLLWRVAGAVTGDGLFHLGRVRKLVDLGDLHLKTVDEFINGGLHPGYAFPLWHGFLALVSKLSGLDPYVVVDHEASVLAPLAMLVVWESGVAVFRSVGGGVSVLAATLGLYCFAAGHGGSYATLALPPTVARQLLVPAFYALFFGYLASGRRVELAALFTLFGALALIHSTYALFALIPVAAYALLRRSDWRRSAAGLGAAILPGLAVYLWLRPLIDQTRTHNPSPASARDALLHYAGQLVVSSLHDYRLSAGVVGRAGAVAVGALALVPFAGFALRRRWATFVLAGSVSVLALMLVPPLFTHFSDFVSLSQSRRAAGFLPFAFALAGGATLLARSLLALPAALLAGVLVEEFWPGDFATGTHGGPALVTWFALIGGAVALVAALLSARRWRLERPGLGACAALLFVLPVAVHGFGRWTPSAPTDPDALPASLVQAVRRLPRNTVIIASPATSYELVADAPVYVVAAPLAHVAHTLANDPEQRIKQVDEWLKTGNPAIPRRYGATWAVRKVGHAYRLYRLGP